MSLVRNTFNLYKNFLKGFWEPEAILLFMLAKVGAFSAGVAVGLWVL